MDELINEQDVIPVVIDRWEINAVGLEEEILCEMCENPMHTDRGCDGLCSYDEGLYKRIIKVLNDRMKPLQPEKPDITHEQAIDYLRETGWLQNHDRILTESKIVPSAQPDVPDINVGDMISRQDAIDAVNRALDRETLLNRLVRKVAIDAIRIVPPVQPTQGIIYCMDCKYFCKKIGFCTLGTGRFVYEGDFCSQAEKKGEADGRTD